MSSPVASGSEGFRRWGAEVFPLCVVTPVATVVRIVAAPDNFLAVMGITVLVAIVFLPTKQTMRCAFPLKTAVTIVVLFTTNFVLEALGLKKVKRCFGYFRFLTQGDGSPLKVLILFTIKPINGALYH